MYVTNDQWAELLSKLVQKVARDKKQRHTRRIRVVSRAHKRPWKSDADIWAHADQRTIYVHRQVFSYEGLNPLRLAERILNVEDELRDARPTHAVGIGRNVNGL